jgi:hypothetical protein
MGEVQVAKQFAPHPLEELGPATLNGSPPTPECRHDQSSASSLAAPVWTLKDGTKHPTGF